MKKLILSLCILALLCGCQKAKETVETTSDAVEIGNTSESYYRMINVGASQLRDDYYSKFSRTDDLMTIGRGLQILSDEYFSMDSYYMSEGQYLTLNTRKELSSYYYMVHPGITGLWQISGRNELNYEMRVAKDSWYVLNWSIWLDIVILFKTPGAVFQKKGAY